MALNGGPGAKKATAALSLGQGCQEESSGVTTSQCSSQHSSTWHGGCSPPAMVGMATVLAVLRLKALGTLECQGQYHPAAPKTFVFLSFFLSLLSCFLKQKLS